MIELRHLRSVVAIAETGSISKAGKRLNLSQPALSHQMKALEDHLGTELFQRKSNPLRLSRSGERLLATAYGRMGREPVAKLHLAEEAALKGDTRFARGQAEAALHGLKPGSSDWLRARDLMDVLEQTPDRPKRRPRT